MDQVREVTKTMFSRYLEILKKEEQWGIPKPFTSLENLMWMCETGIAEIDNYPVDKLSRWLGFVQGVMASLGLVSVEEERDFSRPLFHEAYKANQIAIPPTRNIRNL